MRFFKIFEAEIYFFVYFLHFANMKILLLIKIVYYYIKKNIGARAHLGHDERSEECAKEASATIR
jgi:hypothetical protein